MERECERLLIAVELRRGPNDSISISWNSLFTVQPLLSHVQRRIELGFPLTWIQSPTLLKKNKKNRLTDQNKVKRTDRSGGSESLKREREREKQTERTGRIHWVGLWSVPQRWENSSGISLVHAHVLCIWADHPRCRPSPLSLVIISIIIIGGAEGWQ